MNPDATDFNPKRGGEEELEAILNENWMHMFRVINRKMLDPVAAEDVRQETALAFVNAWRTPGGLSSSGASVDNPVAYLFAIAGKKIKKYYRDRQAKFRSLAASSDIEQADEQRKKLPDPAAASAFEDVENALDVEEHLQRLPVDRRRVVWLVDYAGIPQGKAAQILDIPLRTLQDRLTKGRRALDTLRQPGTEKEDSR